MLVRGLAAGALVAGCADAPTTALTSARRAAAPATGVATAPPAVTAAEPGVIVLQRVTTPARRDAARAHAVRRETWRIGPNALVTRAGIVRLSPRRATDRTGGVATARDAAQLAAELPPVPVLQLPAAPATAVCRDAPAWERTSRVGGLTVVARGRGDVPWSTIEVWSDGRLLTRSQSSWERRRGSWQLVAHEDASIADGATSRVTIDRSAVRRSAREAALPSVACADRAASVVRAAPQLVRSLDGGGANAWSAGLGPVGLAGLELAGATRFAADACTPTEEEVEAACMAQMVAVMGATAAVVGASAAFWTACISPAVVVVAPCVGAVSALTTASATLAVASAAYEECKEEARKPKPTCACPVTNQPATDVAARLVGTTLPVPARSAIDCTAPPPPVGGGGGPTEGGGTGGGGRYVIICTYFDHYDEDGNYLYTTEEGCRYEWQAA
jgi:hypothetical protein